MLFCEKINNWSDWGKVFQSISSFEALLREIFKREGLPFEKAENLTPGTNAVFKAGKYVVKVFFPTESGLNPFPDFSNEAAVCAHLTKENIPTPKFTAMGKIRDKYLFYYIITEYFPGNEAGSYLRTASAEKKESFVLKLKDILARINLPVIDLIPEIDVLTRALKNERLQKLPCELRNEMRARARALDLSERVLVHGDLTGENLLVGEDGGLTVIDCADACIAPSFYELAPIVFELFDCDPLLLRLFAGENAESLVESLIDSVCIHDFGADFLFNLSEKHSIPPVRSLREVREFLLRMPNLRNF